MRTRQKGRASLDGMVSLDRLRDVSTPTRRKNVRTAPRTEPGKAYTRGKHEEDDIADIDLKPEAKGTPGTARKLFKRRVDMTTSSLGTGKRSEGVDDGESDDNKWSVEDDDDKDKDHDESKNADDDDAGDGEASGMDVDAAEDEPQASGSGGEQGLFVVDTFKNGREDVGGDLVELVSGSVASFLSRHETEQEAQRKASALTALPTALDAGITPEDLFIHFVNEGAQHGAATLVHGVESAHDRSMAAEDAKRTAKEKQGPVSEDQRRATKKKSKEPTDAGAKWFHMPRQIITPELEQDLKVVKLRNYLDPKKHYKTNDFAKNGLPKFFQMGRIVAGSAKDKESRLVRKERSRTLVEELMKERDLKHYRKAKFAEIQSRTAQKSRKNSKIVRRNSKK